MKEKKPKVSVIVPVYKVEKYIEKSIRSICDQQYENLEIILVNDGTPDNSIEIAKKVAEETNTDIVVLNKKNGGLPSARNGGIKQATGKYICFIDSDDMISPKHILDLVTACTKYKAKVAYADFQLTYEKNREGHQTISHDASKIDRNTLLRGFLIRKLKIHCCALLIDRQYLISENIWFNENLRYGEDIDFMWRLFPTLDVIAYTGNPTYLYLQRTGSLMTSQNAERVMILMDTFEDTVKQLMKRYPEDQSIFKYLYGKAALAFYRTFAESSSYELFSELLIKSNYRKKIWKVVFIGNFKLSLLAIMLLVSPRLFSMVVKQQRETVIE